MATAAKNRALFTGIKTLIEQAQQGIVRNINSAMLLTYFHIGRMIVEEEQGGKQRAAYAGETLKQLSIDLT